MNKYMLSLLLVLSVCVNASQESDYLEFFNNYQSLANNYDAAITQLYSDDANIIAVRKTPDGEEQTLKVDGKKWKQLVADTIETARQRGDRSEFSNINVIVDKDRAKITASRYSTVKCFHDKQYYMIVSEREHGNLEITEEFMESLAQSQCTNTAKNDLSLVLESSVAMINKQLPVMVDADTKLERTSSEGNVLVYHYELVNYLSTELSAAALEQQLKPLVAQQTCTMPNLKPVVNQGGTISYRYNGKDKKQILVINIDKSNCA